MTTANWLNATALLRIQGSSPSHWCCTILSFYFDFVSFRYHDFDAHTYLREYCIVQKDGMAFFGFYRMVGR